MTKPLTFVSPDQIILEKNHQETRRVLEVLSRLAVISKNLDHIYEFSLFPFNIWQCVVAGEAPEKILASLKKFSAYEPQEAIYAFLKKEEEHAAGLIERYGEKEKKHKKINDKNPFPHKNKFTPRPGQSEAHNAVFPEKGLISSGILNLPGGYGKTILGVMLLKTYGRSCLVLVPNQICRKQWLQEMTEQGGLPPQLIKQKMPAENNLGVLTYNEFIKVNMRAAPVPDLILIDEVHNLKEELLKKLPAEAACVGLTATCQFREKTAPLIFTAIGPLLYEYRDKEGEGKAPVINYFEIKLPFMAVDKTRYLLARTVKDRYKTAACNPEKIKYIGKLKDLFKNKHTIFFSEYHSQLNELKEALGLELLTGRSTNEQRERVYRRFNQGDIRSFISSRITNESINLPEADTIVELSGQRDNSVEEFQRLGRLMRFKERGVTFISLITRSSLEENSALKRRIFLEAKGISVRNLYPEEIASVLKN